MLETVIAMALISVDTADPIQAAIDNYKDVTSYQVTIKSNSHGKTEIIHFYYKKPGFVRMEFVAPFKGAALIYDPGSRRAKLWPFGYGSFPSLSLSPDSSILTSSSGQRVDRSDVGMLYLNVKTLQQHGMTEVIGVEKYDDSEAVHIAVSSRDGFNIGGVARYQLWLERMSGFPLKVISYDMDGRQLEVVVMEELIIEPRLSDGFFRQ